MGKEMEHTCGITESALMVNTVAYAKSYEHIGYLGNGRESKSTLDITLTASHCCSIECGEGCNPGHPMQLNGSIFNPNGKQRGHLINTGHNHGCCMNQGRHRSWTLHGIRQPNVQWEHSTLTCTTNEHKEQGQRHYPCSTSNATA